MSNIDTENNRARLANIMQTENSNLSAVFLKILERLKNPDVADEEYDLSSVTKSEEIEGENQ